MLASSLSRRRSFESRNRPPEPRSSTNRRQKSKSYREVDTTHGTYCCFAVVVERFGFAVDPKGAIKRAQRYCAKCIAMKGKWMYKNGMAMLAA